VVSGTGEAVQHIDWRTDEEHLRNIISYEHAAGVWIGKALREEPRVAVSFLRPRLGQLRGYARHARTSQNKTVPVSALASALVRGLASGLSMKPWRGSVGNGNSESPFPR
jgi:hypothetical protein